MKKIIAKSDGTTLIQHTGRVYFAAKQILKVAEPNIIRFFRLNEQQEVSLRKDFLISALSHDLGKANSEFISFCDKKIDRQNVRHEHISAYIIYNHLKEWMEGNDINPYIVISTVLGHHLKSPVESNDKYPKIGKALSDERKIEIYLESDDVYKILKLIAKETGIVNYPLLKDDYFKEFDTNKLETESNNLDKKYIFALKTLLIWADTLGSAKFEDISISKWVLNNLSPKNINFNEFLKNIRKIKQIKSINNIQLNIVKFSEKSKRVAVIANCGAGKTFAELYFAKHYLTKLDYNRIIHITPTKGLVNETYSKYFIHSKDANIFHSQRVYSLKSLDIDLEERKDIGDVLSNLGNAYYAMTPDQILSSMIFNRKGILLSMLLLNAVVVFDEIHAYDKNMLRFFRNFCDNFNVPVVVMSATTPPNLIQTLKECNFNIFPNPKNTFNKKYRHKRYNIIYHDKMNSDNLKKILSSDYKLALVIVNTVNRCRGVAEELENEGYNVICYHSRYRFKDRMELYKQITDGFSEKTVIVSTQALEIGIDIDADLFISELAPMSSLIQRLGRANRKQNTKTIVNCHFYYPVDYKPYSKDDLKYSQEILKEISGATSYFDLSNCLDNMPSKEIDKNSVAALDMNPLFSFGKDLSFREESLPSENCFVHKDQKDIKSAIINKKEIDDFYVPIPSYDIDNHTKKFPPTFNKIVDNIVSKKLMIKDIYYDKYGYKDCREVILF